MRLGLAKEPRFSFEQAPSIDDLVERYRLASGRDTSAIDWYHVFSRWKLGIVLEGSYAKFLQGRSDKPIHELFGSQVDLLLDHATVLMDGGVA